MTLHTEIDQSFTIYRNSNDKAMGSITFPIGQLDSLVQSLMSLQSELETKSIEKEILIIAEKENEEIIVDIRARFSDEMPDGEIHLRATY